MPWPQLEAVTMSQFRAWFVHRVDALGEPVAAVCRDLNVSRQIGYKWLARHRLEPGAELLDRSRRPHRSPSRTDPAIERLILEVHDRHGWGARKVHAFLLARPDLPAPLPSDRTVGAVLARHGRGRKPAPPEPATQRFERSAPQELWQADFMQDLEIARGRHDQLTVIDDHSRYLLAMDLVPDRSMATAWKVLWELFEQAGVPDTLLTDNGFGSTHTSPRTISWIEARLIRAGVRPVHGRHYHPQTQGKVERVHRTIREEFFCRAPRDDLDEYAHAATGWRSLYNTGRPHEAVGNRPPITRWRPGPRPRPGTLPEVHYDPEAVLRRVDERGQVRWHCHRILAGYGLAGQWVRVEDTGEELNLYYAAALARSIPAPALSRPPGRIL